ncbi:response regulator [Microbaculum marinisediminis]|uniref:Response regulator n=1 Tax=Microbaculum marinisediminis TaxID=2931392 RepID=A0AAW5QV66_9HYPH|nr:response regulator [Microbaculum sp. A6E488]MCT8971961.1 response regulator [Microbaculum sp. A6E488]
MIAGDTTSDRATAAKGRATVPEDTAPHLLVVDDDRRIRTLLSRYLVENGYRVTTADTAAEARRRLNGLTFDLIVLDLMMPGESGIDFAADLRTSSDVPILMLTARSELEHRIQGLEAGADDYLAKPFEPRELLLRIASILRRQSRGQPVEETVCFGPFSFHLGRGELKCGDEIVRLTERERDLLRIFATQPGETVSRIDLAASANGSERAVDVQINRLRRKIETDPGNPIHLQTVRGIGYRLQID